MMTQEINKGLEIRKINGLKFGNKKIYCMAKGYGLYHKDLGFLAFKEDNKDQPAPKPYTPAGGKKALKSILDGGGFIDFDGVEWIWPMQEETKGTATLPR